MEGFQIRQFIFRVFKFETGFWLFLQIREIWWHEIWWLFLKFTQHCFFHRHRNATPQSRKRRKCASFTPRKYRRPKPRLSDPSSIVSPQDDLVTGQFSTSRRATSRTPVRVYPLGCRHQKLRTTDSSAAQRNLEKAPLAISQALSKQGRSGTGANQAYRHI
jgi:hypothetical protein